MGLSRFCRCTVWSYHLLLAVDEVTVVQFIMLLFRLVGISLFTSVVGEMVANVPMKSMNRDLTLF